MCKIMNVLLLFCYITYAAEYDSSQTVSVNSEFLGNIQNAIKTLSDQLKKFNHIYITSLEQKLANTAVKISAIETIANNLQQRAHIWDDFDQHIKAWNEEIAILDRKMDIINKGQEKILTNLDGKIDSIFQYRSKLDSILENQQQPEIIKLMKTLHEKLNSINIPSDTENDSDGILKDILVKLEIILKNIKQDEFTINNEYFEGSGITEVKANRDALLIDQQQWKKLLKRLIEPCKEISNSVEELVSRSLRNENLLRIILDKENVNNDYLTKLISSDNRNKIDSMLQNVSHILDIQFEYQKLQIADIMVNGSKSKCENIDIVDRATLLVDPKGDLIASKRSDSSVIREVDKSSCEDLERDQKDGIYLFGKAYCINENKKTFNERYCLTRNSTRWTVVQKRANSKSPTNFNNTWRDYKLGFGELSRDFWFGNDFLSRLTENNDTILRIELEDFRGNRRWAEYSRFKVTGEKENYKLIVGGHRGNLSDAMGSHNGYGFSTFDRNNDRTNGSPSCAVAFNSGWWFSSCFQVNLNGIYKSKETINGGYQGIIWLPWLNDYSFKKSIMMVRRSSRPEFLNRDNRDTSDAQQNREAGIISVGDTPMRRNVNVHNYSTDEETITNDEVDYGNSNDGDTYFNYNNNY